MLDELHSLALLRRVGQPADGGKEQFVDHLAVAFRSSPAQKLLEPATGLDLHAAEQQIVIHQARRLHHAAAIGGRILAIGLAPLLQQIPNRRMICVVLIESRFHHVAEGAVEILHFELLVNAGGIGDRIPKFLSRQTTRLMTRKVSVVLWLEPWSARRGELIGAGGHDHAHEAAQVVIVFAEIIG